MRAYFDVYLSGPYRRRLGRVPGRHRAEAREEAIEAFKLPLEDLRYLLILREGDPWPFTDLQMSPFKVVLPEKMEDHHVVLGLAERSEDVSGAS